MQLYFSPNSIAVAVGLALFEADLPFEAVRVDFSQSEQTGPDYLKINPKARVPALVTDQGVITETGAILDYIADLAPGAGLRPTLPFDVAKMRSLIHYFASTMHVNHAHSLRGARWADRPESHADMSAKVPETMGQSCAYVESQMTGPFLLGKEICLADFHLYALLRWLPRDKVDIRDFPKLAAFKALMDARPSVQSTVKVGIMA